MDALTEKTLRDRLEREPYVLVAYLFGSQARGTSGPLSDVDVAVLLRDDEDLHGRHLELIEAVASVVGSERADVVLLNTAPVAALRGPGPVHRSHSHYRRRALPPAHPSRYLIG